MRSCSASCSCKRSARGRRRLSSRLPSGPRPRMLEHRAMQLSWHRQRGPPSRARSSHSSSHSSRHSTLLPHAAAAVAMRRWGRSRQLCRHQRRRPLPCRACWPAWGVYGRMLWRGSGAQHCRGPQLGLARAAAAAAAAGQILKSQIQMQATAGGTPARPQARPKQHLARRHRQLRQAGRS
jgi:hypothetical protein